MWIANNINLSIQLYYIVFMWDRRNHSTYMGVQPVLYGTVTIRFYGKDLGVRTC